jgi:hypothetical protein
MMEELAVALLRLGVTAAQLQELSIAAYKVSTDDDATLEALDMLERIHALTTADSSRVTLATYGRALTEAINQADHERIRRGVELVRPILEAHEQLDLTDA